MCVPGLAASRADVAGNDRLCVESRQKRPVPLLGPPAGYLSGEPGYLDQIDALSVSPVAGSRLTTYKSAGSVPWLVSE